MPSREKDQFFEKHVFLLEQGCGSLGCRGRTNGLMTVAKSGPDLRFTEA